VSVIRNMCSPSVKMKLPCSTEYCHKGCK